MMIEINKKTSKDVLPVDERQPIFDKMSEIDEQGVDLPSYEGLGMIGRYHIALEMAESDVDRLEQQNKVLSEKLRYYMKLKITPEISQDIYELLDEMDLINEEE